MPISSRLRLLDRDFQDPIANVGEGKNKKELRALRKSEYIGFSTDIMPVTKQAFLLREIARRYEFSRIKGGGKSRPHSAREKRSGPVFSAGDPVRETGIYEVIHDGAHRSAHEVVMLSGDAFPPCDTCNERVRFRLIRTAPYIFQDEDFGEG